MTENYTITWLFFDFPPLLIKWLTDFCNDMMTPFNVVFPWMYTVLNGLISIGDKLLSWVDKIVPISWVVDGFHDITNFLTELGYLPSLVVIVLFIVVYGLYISFLFFCIDLIDRVLPT